VCLTSLVSFASGSCQHESRQLLFLFSIVCFQISSNSTVLLAVAKPQLPL
jgi:hypothetical protein